MSCQRYVAQFLDSKEWCFWNRVCEDPHEKPWSESGIFHNKHKTKEACNLISEDNTKLEM